jgi:hypothetical protein
LKEIIKKSDDPKAVDEIKVDFNSKLFKPAIVQTQVETALVPVQVASGQNNNSVSNTKLKTIP